MADFPSFEYRTNLVLESPLSQSPPASKCTLKRLNGPRILTDIRMQRTKNIRYLGGQSYNLFFLLLHLLHARVANHQSLLVTLLAGSVDLSPHLLGSPETNSGCRSYFRQSRILTIRLPFVFENMYPPRRAGNTLRVVSDSLTVSAFAWHAADPGSNPGEGKMN